MNIGIAYKNFAAWQNISHIGLGVAAQLNAQYLNANGYNATVVAARNNIDIVDALRKEPYDVFIISAPWLKPFDLNNILLAFPKTQFVINIHSNVGFLQADPGGVSLLRTYINMTGEHSNLRIGSNCQRFANWLGLAYGITVPVFMNLYPFTKVTKTYPALHSINIGTFGAIRPQKNVMTAAATALAIHRLTNLPVEFSVSTGREDGGGNVILSAVRQMCGNIPGFNLVERFWSDWTTFKAIVAQQDLLIQMSYTESFNLVTADGASVGVPSLVSSAIDWAPDQWKVPIDDALGAANIGVHILQHRQRMAQLGTNALQEHNEDGFELWKKNL